jgi:hypothetical protein
MTQRTVWNCDGSCDEQIWHPYIKLDGMREASTANTKDWNQQLTIRKITHRNILLLIAI